MTKTQAFLHRLKKWCRSYTPAPNRRVSSRGLERAHTQLACVLIREMGSEARARAERFWSRPAPGHQQETTRHTD